MTCGQCKHLATSVCDHEFIGEKKLCTKLKLLVRYDSKQCDEFEKKPDTDAGGKVVGKTKNV